MVLLEMLNHLQVVAVPVREVGEAHLQIKVKLLKKIKSHHPDHHLDHHLGPLQGRHLHQNLKALGHPLLKADLSHLQHGQLP